MAIFEENKDTLSTANLLKYIGFLYGKSGNSKLGIQYISRAISLFQNQNFPKGIAVCYFDLARTYHAQRDEENAIDYLIQAKEIWKPYQEWSRIFKINNYLLMAYQQQKDKSNYKKIWIENKKLISKDKDREINENDKIEFFTFPENSTLETSRNEQN